MREVSDPELYLSLYYLANQSVVSSEHMTQVLPNVNQESERKMVCWQRKAVVKTGQTSTKTKLAFSATPTAYKHR